MQIQLNVRSIIGNLLFIAALLLILSRFLSVWSGMPFPMCLVSASSMSPTLMEGDLVAWTPVNIEDVKVGDIIVYRSYVHWPGEKLVVHRVTKVLHDSKGKIILETKGDNNNFTDQAGPHIPEPYIREDHLMGKVISIGNFPLRVPFVGMIGIWINNGLDAISKPTASKGSVNFLGIFAPLTISVVIFVILIFILPEKGKTFREKIRLLIFGPKPLNLKRTLIMFLAAYVGFLLLIHAFAYDSIPASVGINEDSKREAFDFGRIKQGRESLPKDLPLINPGVMPVKGIVFGKGEIGDYVTKKIFVLDRGEDKSISLKAFALNNSKNGSFSGNIMVYSCPFWLIFPDDFIEYLYNFNAELTVYVLDILSGLFLTFITLMILLSLTFFIDKLTAFMIDRSWSKPARLILSREAREKLRSARLKIKELIYRNVVWIIGTKITIEDRKEFISELVKPIVVSISIVPLIFLLPDQMLTLIVSSVLSGILAYGISCKLRRDILSATMFTIATITALIILKTHLIIFDKNIELVKAITLSLGLTGVYLLIFVLLLVPATFISWKISSSIRNVKEQKEPLLCVEGRCDL